MEQRTQTVTSCVCSCVYALHVHVLVQRLRTLYEALSLSLCDCMVIHVLGFVCWTADCVSSPVGIHVYDFCF